MRIAYLSKEYPPYGANYASAVFYPKLAGELARRGHEVHVISQSAPGAREEYEDDGVTVHRLGPLPLEGSGVRRARFYISEWSKLKQLVRKHAIDVVDAPVTFAEGFLCSFLKQAPLVLQTFAFSEMFLTTHSYSAFSEFAYLRACSLLENISIRRADLIIANSPLTYQYLVNEKGVDSRKVKLIWESRIDLDTFKPKVSDMRKSLGIPTSSPLVLYVGWFQIRKGIHILCKAVPRILSRFPETVFVLRGKGVAGLGGYSTADILEEARRQGWSENIKILEQSMTPDELAELYSLSDVCSVPSLWETFGWPGIEAMACGTPVVATRTGILEHLEGSTNGLMIVEPGNVPQLADAILQMLTYARYNRESVRSANRKIVVHNFDFTRMVDQIVQAYEECVHARTDHLA